MARKCQEMRYKWDEKSRYPESRYHLERHPWVLVSWGINNKRLGKDQSTLCSMYPLHFATSIASLHSWAACGTSHILHYFEFANEKNSSLKHFETTCLDFLGLDTILVFNISLRQICASALSALTAWCFRRSAMAATATDHDTPPSPCAASRTCGFCGSVAWEAGCTHQELMAGSILCFHQGCRTDV